MCGIAGFSFGAECTIDPWQAARVLLASVAERGADAAGCAYEMPDGTLAIAKQPGGASKFLDTIELPDSTRQVLLHVRDFTKGRPSLMANNHPIRHGDVVGVHNGRIVNDEHVLAGLGRERFEPGMTVDSEAIFASLDVADGNHRAALELLRGALATGWFDKRRPGYVHLARGYGRPLWTAVARDHNALMWASTLEALEIAEDFLGIALHKRPVRPGTILTITNGAIASREAFTPDAQAPWLLNPVASPIERTRSLAVLMALRTDAGAQTA